VANIKVGVIGHDLHFQLQYGVITTSMYVQLHIPYIFPLHTLL